MAAVPRRVHLGKYLLPPSILFSHLDTGATSPTGRHGNHMNGATRRQHDTPRRHHDETAATPLLNDPRLPSPHGCTTTTAHEHQAPSHERCTPPANEPHHPRTTTWRPQTTTRTMWKCRMSHSWHFLSSHFFLHVTNFIVLFYFQIQESTFLCRETSRNFQALYSKCT